MHQDHLISLGCIPMAENIIYIIQMHLRNADYKKYILSANAQRLTKNHVLSK